MSHDHSPDTLVSLLADDASTTRAAVKKALVGLGPNAIPALRRATDGDDPMLRARARQVLLDLRKARGHARLREVLAEDEVSLVDGLLAIDEVLGAHDPALDVLGQLDRWAARVRELTGDSRSSTAVAAALRSTLGAEAGFVGPERDFHNANHVSLTHTVETRRGLPLSLCAVYAMVARRAGYEASILPFPGQVLLHVRGDDERRILDPFVGGNEITEAACLARLCAMGAPPSREWLRPATDRAMVVRQLRNLVAAMDRHDRTREAVHLLRLLEEV